MSQSFAALPMYDHPDLHAETEAEWSLLCKKFESVGLSPPKKLTRCNADLPHVPNGSAVSDDHDLPENQEILPPDGFDLKTVWTHPDLFLAQTCWGPLSLGLSDHVQVVGQPDYSAFPGGQEAFYSSAIIMNGAGIDVIPNGSLQLPIDFLRGKRLARNGPASLSGFIALDEDLKKSNQSIDLFAEITDTGSHFQSIASVSSGKADVAAIDCRTLSQARRVLSPGILAKLHVVGWTSLRLGLPYITSRNTSADDVAAMRAALDQNQYS